MNKTEIKNATTQELIEALMSNERSIVFKGGFGVKGLINESRNIAKELSGRNIIDFDSFVKSQELQITQ